MIGNLMINLVLAMIGFFFVFTISLTSNVLITSLFRGGFAFVCFFLLAFLIRMLIGYIMKDLNSGKDDTGPETGEQKHKNSENNIKEHQDEQQIERNNHKQDDLFKELTSEEFPDVNQEKRKTQNQDSSEDVIKKTSEYVRELMNEDE